MYLPLANLLHHKLGTALSALGIGIGLCMLITLSGLSRGSLYEPADRWESVNADLFAYPEIWGRNVTSLSGVGLPDRYADVMTAEHPQLVRRITPVFLWQINLGGQGQLAAGVNPDDLEVLFGGKALVQGRRFDPNGTFSAWIEQKLLEAPADADRIIEVTPEELAAHGGMEILIDERLADAAGYEIGQTVSIASHGFRIVGIAPTGGMSRVYLPRRTAQFLFGSGDITKSTLLFIELEDGVEPNTAARKLGMLGLEIVQLRQFRQMLEHQFGIMFVFVDAVNAVAVTIAFLFIMTTLYTVVLQRRRDIAILKSSGASNGFILRQVLAESLLLTALGTMTGVVLSLTAGALIETFRPLLTVQWSWRWIGIACLVAATGAILSGLYPAWRATRVDMIKVLAWE